MWRIIGFLIGGIASAALARSASAHGGGPESAVSFGAIVNWLHFITTALWLGGIVVLRLAVSPSVRGDTPQSRVLQTAINVRFTHLVWWCIGGLAFTGVLTTWVHVPSLETVSNSAYGIILAFKLAISAGMIACNAVISIALARRSRRPVVENPATRSTTGWSAGRWVGFASRLSLLLALLMMFSIAALVEFDRSPWGIILNFLRLSALTVWFGGTAFLPLVLSPSLRGIDRAYLVGVNGRILRRFSKIVTVCAIMALASTALTIVKNLGSPSDLWETGYGSASLLEMVILAVMAVVLWRSWFVAGFASLRHARPSGPAVRLATSKTMRRAIDASGANLVLGLGALLFSSIGGALYSPEESTLANQIPTAATIISLDWFEPLGYVIAGVVALALIWYFGVMEGNIARRREAESSSAEAMPNAGHEEHPK